MSKFHTGWLGRLRLKLAYADASIPYAMLGLAAGLLTGVLIIAYRHLLEALPALWMPGHDAENFEGLSLAGIVALPIVGGLVLGLFMSRFDPRAHRVGVVHVVGRLHRDHPRFPLQNLWVQIVGSAIALMSGQSGGREGPGVHLGAAGSAIAGQRLGLPDNALRILAACGSAAAIAALFNTPIAGVIFAMEVVLLEYTVAGFVPVILAAGTATAMTQAVYGSDSVFGVVDARLYSLTEIPWIVVLGILAGALSASLVAVQSYAHRFLDRPVVLRMLAAGTLTAVCAALSPAVMGMGYDSITAALSHSPGVQFLLALLVLKVVATGVSAGLGMPIGVIGPSLLIGATAGCLLSVLVSHVHPLTSSGTAFYVLIGMGACMGALMNAPLAAMLAVMELTHNPAIIFPAMLGVVTAQLCHRDLFRQFSSPQAALLASGEQLKLDPLSQVLRRRSAITEMDRNTRLVTPQTDVAELLATGDSQWFVLEDNEQRHYVLSREALETQWQALAEGAGFNDLVADLKPTPELDILGTLQDALDLMIEHDCHTVMVVDDLGASPFPEPGVLSRAAVESVYRRQD